MLTDEEIRLAGDAYILRQSETSDTKWFAPAHELEDAARRLFAGEYLDRRWDGGTAVYRFSDAALLVQEQLALTATHMNPN